MVGHFKVPTLGIFKVPTCGIFQRLMGTLKIAKGRGGDLKNTKCKDLENTKLRDLENTKARDHEMANNMHGKRPMASSYF